MLAAYMAGTAAPPVDRSPEFHALATARGRLAAMEEVAAGHQRAAAARGAAPAALTALARESDEALTILRSEVLEAAAAHAAVSS